MISNQPSSISRKVYAWRNKAAIIVFLSDGYLAQSRLEAAKGNYLEAHASIEAVQRLMEASQTSIDENMIGAKRASLLLAQGDWEAVELWVQNSGLEADGEFSFVHEYSFIVLARVFLGQGRYEQARRLLDRLLQNVLSGDRKGRAIEILLLQAVLYQSEQKLSLALSVLKKAVTLARPGRYMRTFLDGGAPLAALLQQLYQLSPEDYLARLMVEFARQGTVETYSPTTASNLRFPVAPLSERELQVLCLIAAGRSYQEISQQLLVAVSTIQSHVKHAYYKLDAHSGLEATARARQLHLIP